MNTLRSNSCAYQPADVSAGVQSFFSKNNTLNIMKNVFRRSLRCTFLAVAFLFCSLNSWAQSEYTITEINSCYPSTGVPCEYTVSFKLSEALAVAKIADTKLPDRKSVV